jgi:hypothetical protein|tara:strand:- start:545 stop:760 length:216 start_codon:yes stop_codon:yes gene_type:complete
MSYNKRAAEFLPEDLQIAINTFIEQFNIMEEHDLETIPTEYSISLLQTMRKYPEYNNILLDLINILEEGLS